METENTDSDDSQDLPLAQKNEKAWEARRKISLLASLEKNLSLDSERRTQLVFFSRVLQSLELSKVIGAKWLSGLTD